MPIYHPEPGDDAPKFVERRSYQSLACRLLLSGPVALYCSRTRLDADLEELRTEQFDVRRMNAGGWSSKAAAHEDLETALGLPDYYGRNLDALNDCMGDLEISDE